MSLRKYNRAFRRGIEIVLTATAIVPVTAQLSEARMKELEAKLPVAAATVDFERHVWPILDNKCIRCHGPEKPKSKFRIDSKENALKGGELQRNDIVPGQSARSPLVFYVARLEPDMEMPPPGKGDALTSEEVALIRAWIDQGMNWSVNPTNVPPKFVVSVTPQVQWFSVKGDEKKFREHTGIHDGLNGGVESIYYQEQIDASRRLTFEGTGFVRPEDYKLRLQVEQRDLGFVELGFEQYREFYDDTGGYDPLFSPSAFSLDRDLHMDIGRAWVNVGVTLPNWPRMVFGYEHQYRNGTKSLLQWGDAGTVSPAVDIAGTDAKKIYPAPKDIDEEVHIFKFDLTHDIHGVGVENNFRAELYDNKTERTGVDFYNVTTGTAEKYVQTKEDFDHFQASDALKLEKQMLDWLFVSGGYYFSRLDGQYGFSTETISPIGLYGVGDVFWFGDSITLEQNTHVFNANTQLGPWDGLTVYGGVQGEWMNQRGFGSIRLDEGIPGSIVPEPATVDSDIDRWNIQENVGLRYTKIPYTVLFAEGNLSQETLGQFENEVGGEHEFLRDTDASTHFGEGRVGFTFSPWSRVSLTAQYKYRDRDIDYDHLRDEAFGAKNEGYSAFITHRDTRTDEVSAKLTVRPTSWLKAALTYQLVATDFHTATDPNIVPEIVIPGVIVIPEQILSPGGLVFAGNYDASIYSANVSLNPLRRVYLSETFSYRHTRTSTANNISPVVVPYEGDVYSSMLAATFVMNNKTDITGGYTYSWADYGQNNFPAGLPLGEVYQWHMANVGITRKIKRNVTANLQYRFYYYDEEKNGGINNYTAHGILASVAMVMP
jgi:hypothetical protein